MIYERRWLADSSEEGVSIKGASSAVLVFSSVSGIVSTLGVGIAATIAWAGYRLIYVLEESLRSQPDMATSDEAPLENRGGPRLGMRGPARVLRSGAVK